MRHVVSPPSPDRTRSTAPNLSDGPRIFENGALASTCSQLGGSVVQRFDNLKGIQTCDRTVLRNPSRCHPGIDVAASGGD